MGLKSGMGDDPNDPRERDRSDGKGKSNEGNTTDQQPYLVRRMLKDGSVTFERPVRMNFVVHKEIEDGEDELRDEAKDRFGRKVPRYDLREAAYRAAINNPELVFSELRQMGYSDAED